MALKQRKPPAGGWWRGRPENHPGSYKSHVGIATSVSIPGFSTDDRGGVETWSGQALFLGDKESVESPAFYIAWSCRYRPAVGAEARCRTATDKAVIALQAYYDKTGVRWECVVGAARWKGETLPRLPPSN